MLSYKARGIVLGNCWGGGVCGYAAHNLIADSLIGLEQQILARIKDGSLDAGMGYESLIGAVMEIDTIDTRKIDGKVFVATETDLRVFGKITPEQEEMLIDAIYS